MSLSTVSRSKGCPCWVWRCTLMASSSTRMLPSIATLLTGPVSAGIACRVRGAVSGAPEGSSSCAATTPATSTRLSASSGIARRISRMAPTPVSTAAGSSHAAAQAAPARRDATSDRIDPPTHQAERPLHRRRQPVVVGGDDQGRATLRVELQEELMDTLTGLRVEVARGLVGQEQARATHHPARHRHPLLLATRELAGAVVHAVLQPHARQERRCTRARLARRLASDQGG